MSKKHKTVFFSVSVLLIMAILLCGVWLILSPKTLIDTDTLRVVQNGSKLAVYDLAGHKEYNYKSVPSKRSSGVSAAVSAVRSDTLNIDILNGELLITDKTAERLYTIRRKVNNERGKEAAKETTQSEERVICIENVFTIKATTQRQKPPTKERSLDEPNRKQVTNR